MCDGEGGSGPKGADDLHIVSFEALRLNLSINNGSVRLSILGMGVKGARGVVQCPLLPTRPRPNCNPALLGL